MWQVKSKVKSILIIFFEIKRIVHKEFILADQAVNLHTTVTFKVTAWKYVNTLPRTLAVKELAVASQHTISHFLFHQGVFDQKQRDHHSPPTLLAWIGPLQLFRFPRLKIHHSETVEVIEAESQRCSWTPSQNMTSRMNLENDRNIGNGAYTWKETTSRAMFASRPKVSFCPDGSTSPGYYELFLTSSHFIIPVFVLYSC
jgi:hypothetical protein